MIDFDHNATTPLHPKVAASMATWLGRGLQSGNPSSRHGRGRAAREGLERDRAAIAAALGSKPEHVTLCSGGTEADNLAVIGCARGLRAKGAPCGVLSSRLEHPAVLESLACLRDEGHDVIFVPADGQGRIGADLVAETVASHPEIGLVSLSAANHELGNAYDIPAVVTAVRSICEDTLIHCDAVQAFGKVPVKFVDWGVDLLSVSSHKIFGPAGAGALCHRRRVPLRPLQRGGGQERGLRPGTESLLCMHGFAVAATMAVDALSARSGPVTAMRGQLLGGLVALGGRIHGDGHRHIGNTVNVGFPSVEGDLLAMSLDLEGFAISTGAACSSGVIGPSPVLVALGFTPDEAREAVRFSLGPQNTPADIDAVLDCLPQLVERIRAAGIQRGAV